MKAERHVQTFQAEWNGIAIEITWEPSWLSLGECLGHDMGHLEIRTLAPEQTPLPITETGYRSHFSARDTVFSLGGPVAFVLAWLDEESHRPAWQKAQQAARQFSLF